MTTHSKRFITWSEVIDRVKQLPAGKYYGVPRGGIIIAALTGQPVSNILEADYIVDDLIDSGKTAENHARFRKPFLALFNKKEEAISEWLVFPWETAVNETPAEDSVTRLLQSFGENVEREGLVETPKRYIKFFREFLTPETFKMTVFDSENYDEMISQTGIPFYSLCEHHLAPFFGTASVAYIPNGKIVGLSKLARTVDLFARKLQNQERMTQQIANFLQEHLNAKGVAVSVKARHMCMEMRGIKKHDVYTTTSCLKGAFLNDEKTRAEFFNTCKI